MVNINLKENARTAEEVLNQTETMKVAILLEMLIADLRLKVKVRIKIKAIDVVDVAIVAEARVDEIVDLLRLVPTTLHMVRVKRSKELIIKTTGVLIILKEVPETIKLETINMELTVNKTREESKMARLMKVNKRNSTVDKLNVNVDQDHLVNPKKIVKVKKKRRTVRTGSQDVILIQDNHVSTMIAINISIMKDRLGHQDNQDHHVNHVQKIKFKVKGNKNKENLENQRSQGNQEPSTINNFNFFFY